MDRADRNREHVDSALLEHAFSVIGSTFLDCSSLVFSSKLTNFALDYCVKGMRYFAAIAVSRTFSSSARLPPSNITERYPFLRHCKTIGKPVGWSR